MVYQSQVLAKKLRRICLVSGAQQSSLTDISELAGFVEAGRFEEFAYIRRVNGELQKEYAGKQSVSRYVGFMQVIGLLDDSGKLLVSSGVYQVEEDFYRLLADIARDYLDDNQLDIDRIEYIANSILRDDQPVLPTIRVIYDNSATQTGIPLQHFRWLIYLYLLNEGSKLHYWQKPLIVSGSYAKHGTR